MLASFQRDVTLRHGNLHREIESLTLRNVAIRHDICAIVSEGLSITKQSELVLALWCSSYGGMPYHTESDILYDPGGISSIDTLGQHAARQRVKSGHL